MYALSTVTSCCSAVFVFFEGCIDLQYMSMMLLLSTGALCIEVFVQ